MNGLANMIRPDLRDLAPYSSARDEAQGFIPAIGIDANEFPWPSYGVTAAACTPNRYPEPQPQALVARMATVWNIPQKNLLIGRGSDEGIDVLVRLFCRTGIDNILICPPTYGMYKVAARIQGASVTAVPLNREAQLDLPAIRQACTPETKLIFIPSPNAPMGHLMRREDILSLCRDRAEQSLIVVDEAYIEFSNTPDGMLPDIAATPNLVVLRTLSKAHALAGERVGCVIAAPELVQELQKILAPYPLTQTSIRAASEALSPNGLIHNGQRRRQVVQERERMAALLPRSPFITAIYPSVTNFLLVGTTDAKAFMQRLRRFGILARNRNSDIANTVRLSIGTPEENDLVLAALDVPLDKPATPLRLYSAQRATKETTIAVTVNLDAPDFLKAETGIGFFDHMLAQIATHGGFGMELNAKGDLTVDQHHTVEDCALTLGECLKAALGDKRGIARFGFTAPLDEALAQVTIDLSGRPCCVFTGTLPASTVGTFNSEMVPHFFQSLATAMGAAIHVTVQGDNTHHMIEAAFKATGRALRQAMRREGQSLPSTKGVL